jgi:hypothetical protein
MARICCRTSAAHALGEKPQHAQHVHLVRCSVRELWGDQAIPQDAVSTSTCGRISWVTPAGIALPIYRRLIDAYAPCFSSAFWSVRSWVGFCYLRRTAAAPFAPRHRRRDQGQAGGYFENERLGIFDTCAFQAIVIIRPRPSWSPIPEHRDHRFQAIVIKGACRSAR